MESETLLNGLLETKIGSSVIQRPTKEEKKYLLVPLLWPASETLQETNKRLVPSNNFHDHLIFKEIKRAIIVNVVGNNCRQK